MAKSQDYSPSTKVSLVHDQMLAGMNQGVPDHLVPENQWWMQFNFRTKPQGIYQVPRLETVMNGLSTAEITEFQVVPSGKLKNASIYGFSDRVGQLVGQTEMVDVVLDGVTNPLYTSGEYLRWAMVQFEGRVYFTNLECPCLVLTEHPKVRRLSPSAPAAQHVETFYDHLVFANLQFGGRHPYRVEWSNLRNFGDFTKKKSSESDYFDLLEHRDLAAQGITGLKRWGNKLIVYTSSSIHYAEYVGLPTIMRFHEMIKDVGNDYPYSLIAVDRFHFFISDLWQNIVCFDGTDTPQPIGDDIAPFFFEDLTNDLELKFKVFAYRDTANRELVWAYCSKQSTGGYDREIVFSLRTRKWYARSSPNVTAFTEGGNSNVSIDSLAGSINNLLGTIENLGRGESITRYFACGATIAKEYSTGTPLAQETPYLETGDFEYGNAQFVKEWDSMCIMAGLGTAHGIEVYVSIRQNHEDPHVWTRLPQIWTPALPEGRLSAMRIAGRIMRFRFVPVKKPGSNGFDNVKWAGFIENVYGAKQVEK